MSYRSNIAFWLCAAVVIALVLLFGCGCLGGYHVPVTKPGEVTPAPNVAKEVVRQAVNLPWLITASILGLAGSLAGLVFLPGPGRTVAMAGAVFCGLALGLTILVAAYAQWLVLGAVLLCVGIGVYAVLRAKKTATVLKTAIPELVKTVEVCKGYLTNEAKTQLFGPTQPSASAEGAVGATIQSPATAALVADARKNFK
jgi:hypothetical protein